MKKVILLMVLLLGVFAFSAQDIQSPKSKSEQMRTKIGLDYSMPDYATKKIDDNLIGKRLAQILTFLDANYHQGSYNQQLCRILCQQAGISEHAKTYVSKIKLTRISKKGDEIVICYKANWIANGKNTSSELTFMFKKGLSDNDKVNMLFEDIAPYATAKRQYF